MSRTTPLWSCCFSTFCWLCTITIPSKLKAVIPNSVYMGMDPPKDGGMPCFSGLICFLLNDDDDGGDDGSEERRVSILNSTQLLW